MPRKPNIFMILYWWKCFTNIWFITLHSIKVISLSDVTFMWYDFRIKHVIFCKYCRLHDHSMFFVFFPANKKQRMSPYGGLDRGQFWFRFLSITIAPSHCVKRCWRVENWNLRFKSSSTNMYLKMLCMYMCVKCRSFCLGDPFTYTDLFQLFFG